MTHAIGTVAVVLILAAVFVLNVIIPALSSALLDVMP